MRYIANKVALETVLYAVEPLQKLKVIDYERSKIYRDMPNKGEYKEVYSGLARDYYGHPKDNSGLDYWELHAEIRTVKVEGEYLVIGVCTDLDDWNNDYKVKKEK